MTIHPAINWTPDMTPPRKLGLSQRKWIKTVTEVCAQYGMAPEPVLAGSKAHRHVGLRWEAWRILAAYGHSYAAIGKTSGYDHTSVRYGVVDAVRERYMGLRSPRGTRQRHPFLKVTPNRENLVKRPSLG